MERYPAIQLVMRIGPGLAWVVAGAVALLALFAFLGMASAGGMATVAGFFEFLVGLVFASLIWLALRVVPEVLAALVQIDVNTRRPDAEP
jgi:uncharacterized membrane protein